ncbi:MAG TPA: radical SAM protein [Gemmatales bacterium]|nr:radical SAM protein [Gemmatales bacterium]
MTTPRTVEAGSGPVQEARSIFSPATGFIRRAGFAWTCNPYLGCTFGCRYCYAMYLPQNRRPISEWGRWFAAKRNAVELAQHTAAKLRGAAVYLSSVTDPYLPIERRLHLTRGILEALLPFQPRLLVQTRGPLVVRDLDLFQQWDAIRVNVSIPTDDDAIRQTFEPKAPPLEKRWDALAALRQAGIPVGICVTPLLPLARPQAFVERLLNFAPEVLVVQEFHESGGRFGADTAPAARELAARHEGHAGAYAAVC